MNTKRFNRFLATLTVAALIFSGSIFAEKIKIRVLYTNDEHGWIDSSKNSGGASALLHLIEAKRAENSAGITLTLSGGDHWTGPALATLTKGAPVVEVFKSIPYDASAVGNHEFDFGVDITSKNFSESGFPHLAANIAMKKELSTPDFVNPFEIKEIKGVKIGIIGLTTTETPSVTMEKNTGDFVFLNYEKTIKKYASVMKLKGVDLIFAICHICTREMSAEFIDFAKKNGISFLGGGHCHDTCAKVVDDVAIMEAGSYLRYLGVADFRFDSDTKSLELIETRLEPVPTKTFDNRAKNIVSEWKKKTDGLLSEVIGYAKSERISPKQLAKAILKSWISVFPEARAAIGNKKGVRQGIPAGDITVATVYGILPFDNDLYQVTITGDALIENLKNDNADYYGVEKKPDGYYFLDGNRVVENEKYKVVVNSFIYPGGDNFTFKKYDENPEITTINSREPFINWIKSCKTNKDNPIDERIFGRD